MWDGFPVVIRDPAGTRTQDPYIKSVLLYQLSYGIAKKQYPCLFEAAKVTENRYCPN
jgi:hypothetical protein